MNTGEEKREEAAEYMWGDKSRCRPMFGGAGGWRKPGSTEDSRNKGWEWRSERRWGRDDKKSAVELTAILHPSVISLITHPQGLSAVVKTTSMLPPPCVVRALMESPRRTLLATPPSRWSAVGQRSSVRKRNAATGWALTPNAMCVLTGPPPACPHRCVFTFYTCVFAHFFSLMTFFHHFAAGGAKCQL